MLNLSEIFQTIQGEAMFTGTPSIFIRTQGCDVGCSFCDTKYTWEFSHQISDQEEAWAHLINRSRSPEAFKMFGFRLEADFLIQKLKAWAPTVRHLVITGGEPMAQPGQIRAFISEAIVSGYSVQIETSGTYLIDLPGLSSVWITCSPKIGMRGGREVLAQAIARADEIKFPIGKPADADKLIKFMEDHDLDPQKIPIWVQPLSQGKSATDLCLDLCYRLGVRLSIQTHKYIGLD